MRIAVLGPLEVRRDDGAPVEIPGAKERLLLAVLATDAGRVVGTDRIVEALWNGDPPTSARKSLQAHLVRLRTALEPGRPRGSTGRYIVRRGSGYALVLDRGNLDALRLGELTALGRARLASGEAGAAVGLLTEAVHLWRGEPYTDWPDAEFAEAERRRLAELHAVARAALLEARLGAGEHVEVVPELERLVLEDPLREGWWRLLMLALYRSGRQADALAAGRRARALLSEELGADPGPALREMEAAVLRQDAALDLPTSVPVPVPVPVPDPTPAPPAAPTFVDRCPYMGLAAYQPSDAPLFHGRRRLVTALVARLVDTRLLAVSGPSGAGKSSVVRAGLLPALAAGALPGAESWRQILMTPGSAPVDALAELTGDEPPDDPVLLVCDQFEELWAPGVDRAERETFLDTVLGLLDDGIVARCVVAVRGDSVGRLAEHAAFADRVAGAVVLVPPLTDPELREIVREPAAAVGLTVEPELLDVVVADVLGRPGALPLLSTALVGTWERRRGTVLTLAGHLEAGGVSGALISSAEAAYESLDPDARESARRLLIRLADVDDAGALIRRRVPLAELDLDGARTGLGRQVVETFVARRLLSVDRDRVEVTHEALLTGWPRLVRWLEDDATGRAVRRHLAPAAQDWAARGRPDDELVRGARLAAALDWAESAESDVTAVERSFLAASRARAEAELEAARRGARREAAGRRRTRRLAAGLAAGMVAALVATGLAARSSQDAQDASRSADAARLATLAGTAGSADVALLLAVQAARLADLPETRSALLGAVVAYGRVVRVGTLPEPATGIAAISDGTVLVDSSEGAYTWPSSAPGPQETGERTAWWGLADRDVASRDALVVGGGLRPGDGSGWVRVGSADGEVRDLAVDDRLGGTPLAVAFSEDGSRIATLLADGDVGPSNRATAWHVSYLDIEDGRRTDTGIRGDLPGDGPLVADLDEEGREGVVARLGTSGVAELVDVRNGSRTPVQIPAKVGTATGFRALRSGAAQLWADGEMTLYGPDGRVRQRLDAGRGRVEDVVLAPDGTWGATVGSAGAVLWDVDPASSLWTARDELVGHAGAVVDAEVAAGGDQLVTAGEDGRVVVWDATPEGGFGDAVLGAGGGLLVAPPQVVNPGRVAVGVTVSGHPRAFVPAGPDPLSATFFSPTTGESTATVPIGARAPGSVDVPAVSVSPDRTLVAVRTETAVVVLDAGDRAELSRYEPGPTPAPDGTPLPPFTGCLAWAPDSSRVLVCTQERDGYAVTAVDPRDGSVMDRTPTDLPLDVLALSRDRRLLAGVYLYEGLVVGLDAATLELDETVSFDVAPAKASHVSVSPDGTRIAVSGVGGLVVVDTRAWEPVPTPAPLNGEVRQAEWFRDGRTLAVVGGDGTTYLYDVEQGQAYPMPLLPPGDDPDAGVHLVPDIEDELVVLVGLELGRRYPLDPDTWSSRACAVVGRDLTEEEWGRYLPGRGYEPTCSAPG